LNYAAYCPFTTLANIQAFGFIVAMNKDKWNSLPNDVKKVFDDLARDQALWTGKYADDHAIDAIEWAKQKYKLKVLDFSAKDKAEILRLSKPLVDDYIKRANGVGLPGDQIVKDVNRLKEKYEKEYK